MAFCATSPARDMNYAFQFFTHIEEPNLFSWNTIIRGFSQSSVPHFAILLFIEMLESSCIEPEHRTYPSVFKAYTQLGLAEHGAQLHGRVIKLGLDCDSFVRNSVIYMYASCGYLGCAMKLFDENEDWDVVAWNSMIMGYAKSGEMDECWRLFRKMPFRNGVSWNSMISGCVRNGKWNAALSLFNEMQGKGVEPSEYVLVSVLNACGKLGALEQGKWIHDYIKRNGIELNVIVVTAIIDMYSRCGSIEIAREVFESVARRGLSCWNSMMFGLAMNGFEDKAFDLFLELENSCLKPDSVSFVAVLTACNHSGQVDRARKYFKLMKEVYKIEPSIEHYGCFVDVLGRAGLIEEAAEVVRSMPIQPDSPLWGSLLSACVRYRNVEVAEWAAQNLIRSEPDNTSAHVLMSNLYAALGHSEKAMHERILMKKEQKERLPGCSLIEVNGEVHEFLAAAIWEEEHHDVWNLAVEPDFDSVLPLHF